MIVVNAVVGAVAGFALWTQIRRSLARAEAAQMRAGPGGGDDGGVVDTLKLSANWTIATTVLHTVATVFYAAACLAYGIGERALAFWGFFL
ncbi:hypothetical protein DFJ73DRAFT_819796 [Zopfochytrium polystomum]|nr:hypothetical protein DFJ73DRAFT_819796 [Zopfochytrium polystomum]